MTAMRVREALLVAVWLSVMALGVGLTVYGGLLLLGGTS